ncbi:MFS general substrate transporter [Pleomassaria siparia CBS 279.74]|uniref:MFS general substrate transporter n=1 Tax=Pleomassaria siparia CBS 279.74 TaxID=1314801 RepID=A0A6G1K606_9PLEO|nr:MFS general substrate transporter [Pleomassaria siparia CBS 279.74]
MPLNFLIGAAMYSFAIAGLFTSSLGVMLPHLEQYYYLTDLSVSLIFLTGPVGYIFAAQSTDFIHRRFGQRGIASSGPFFHLLAAAVICSHPPFPVVLAGCAIANFGTGLLDVSWCAWAGGIGRRANTVSGMLHGSYSTGAALGPFLAGTLMAAGQSPWYYWYYVLAAVSVLEIVILPIAFQFEDAATYCLAKHDQSEQRIDNEHPIKAIFKHRATWVSSAYFLADVGIESAISGWIVSFLIRARDATPYIASLSSSGFWAGMAVGRLSLGVVTDRISVRRAMVIYLSISIGLQSLFAVTSSPIVSILLASMLGFIMGPFFPSGIVVLSGLLPSELHITAVSFVASVGQIGGAVLPFVIGATVQGLGIGVFKYVVLILLGVTLGIWIVFSTVKKNGSTWEIDADDVDD